MKIQDLLHSATWIVAQNLTPNIVQARIVWNSTARILSLTYVTRKTPSDDDIDLCELSISELIAEYPDIDGAETACVVANALEPGASDYIVYSR
ncbi:MAG TPA: hypothetical protein VKZ94_18410 [Advenella sp.]|nr:hypothetical protein [Advenella sp.]